MEPFKVATQLKGVLGAYPSPEAIVEAGKHGGEQARCAIARLWLSEGIPWAFRERPATYETVRTWLGNWLDVDSKEISVTGSARLGASLAPRKQGKPFGNNSDIDVFVVSERLFDVLREEFLRWSFDFESSQIVATNEREKRFWRDNHVRGHNLLQRGFMDQKLIPNRSRYPETKKISQGMWLLVEKLKVTPCAPRPKQASVRCYSSWQNFVRQTSLNLA